MQPSNRPQALDAATLAKRLSGRKVGRSYMALCPAHDDHEPSLAISTGDKLAVVVHCHAGCSQHAVLSALERKGLWTRRPPRQFLPKLHREIQEAMSSYVWTYPGGATDLAILSACLDITELCGHQPFGASYRALAEDAGVNETKTVENSLRRLQTAGWLVRDIRGWGERATTWILQVPQGGSKYYIPEDALRSVVIRSARHDAFRWGALGLSTGRVYSALPGKTSELAIVLGMGDRNVRQHLAKLRLHGLAVETAGISYRTDRDLNEVARELGADGRGEAQRCRHQEERDRYREALRNGHKSPALYVDHISGEVIDLYGNASASGLTDVLANPAQTGHESTLDREEGWRP